MTDQPQQHRTHPDVAGGGGLDQPLEAPRAGVRTYVVDTSVLLSEPHALSTFAEHEVVVPIVVIAELEAKRHHPDLGHFARVALRMLDDLRERNGGLDRKVVVNESGGTLRVELNHADPGILPDGFRLGDNDTRILAVAAHHRAAGHDVVLVSKDLPLRIKASAIGLGAEEYRHELAIEGPWSGMATLEVPDEVVAQLHATGWAEIEEAADLPVHTGLVVKGPGATALGRRMPDATVRLVPADREVFGIRGRSAEQRIALDLLADPEVGIVSLGGRAGTGKSALALCSGLEAVLEQGRHAKVMVFRPLYAVGGQDLGYLPGSEDEKMASWGQAVLDTLTSVTTRDVVDEVISRGMLEVLPLTHIRGRSLQTPSSSSTRRSPWSETSCSPCSRGSGRTRGWCSPTTSPSATTCGWAATTGWPRWSRGCAATRCSPTSPSPAPNGPRSPRWSPR